MTTFERVNGDAVASLCGLCLNAFFVHSDRTIVLPYQRVASIHVIAPVRLPFSAPPPIDRPPRAL